MRQLEERLRAHMLKPGAFNSANKIVDISPDAFHSRYPSISMLCTPLRAICVRLLEEYRIETTLHLIAICCIQMQLICNSHIVYYYIVVVT